ncbi:hypothetical protein Mal15_28060 [Stieleria maiorica]|uniref:Pilus assembly protein, PilO n=1 Tax=Stieleria maiorica TaxID=2795974 RepID=A0A5B9MBT4_9BACT|nr:hypothetical protein [Stieleria maiorica]QEF98751.1 hypothetical protein Mal15_28060 [Stieleria maiorica]
MDNQLFQTFLEHPRRGTIVWGSTVVFALLFIVPAWDHYSGARSEVAEYKTELREISYSLSNLDLLRSKLKEIESQPHASNDMIDADAAAQIRETVTKLAQRIGCRVRRLTMSHPVVRPWHVNDHPFDENRARNAEETNFRLETRTLTLSVGGSFAELTKLTIALTRLHRFAVPSNMNLQREGNDGHLILDVEISLFNLAETYD